MNLIITARRRKRILCERIAKELWEGNGIKSDTETDIIVTPSGKMALYQAIVAFAEAGDEVPLLEPN